MKSAVTVTGLVPADRIGRTLPHEHLFATMTYAYPAANEEAYRPITIDRLGEIRSDLMTNVNNIHLDSSCGQALELKKAADAGIDTLVELTTEPIGRNPERMVEVSEYTGVNVVSGTGQYLAHHQRPWALEASREQLAELMIRELTVGIGDTGIRTGVIGEIGLFEPVRPAELKVLEAAVLAQHATGAPLWVHLMNVPVVDDALRVFDEYEPIYEKTAFCHMDFDIRDLSWHERAMDRGISVEFDFFGSVWLPVDHYVHCPTDPQRLAVLADWSERGYADRVLISHDVCSRVQFTSHGGYGYAYIPTIVPKLMDQMGIDRELLDIWMIDTPRRLLAWADE